MFGRGEANACSLAHPCNMKEFKILVGLTEGNMTEVHGATQLYLISSLTENECLNRFSTPA